MHAITLWRHKKRLFISVPQAHGNSESFTAAGHVSCTRESDYRESDSDGSRNGIDNGNNSFHTQILRISMTNSF